ncbi:phosphoribosylaminoimidazolesuccinocarboxamide synthase [Sutcliffiella rhizosphaerae]|uniref:Phosphoribosylaminoimidazole-succinocarboxamide synthase n=1 Tax=Sutcliffiella rhizosphaerae TaxID=2880967 RepID=A0ABM8YN14_9BACI|nr:phosphoribosylaminoimidazolesuccinocarboxamide synthase [Sutcliffiella rhizosphaerae]CAG9621361.1 Phosphoribosylaminoimidazole-succinocarboxamide synthase [Sutcliffiella rhizosphaerae]
MTVEKTALLYEGKAKLVYTTTDEDVVWIEYKNSATAFNGEKKADITGKGRLNNEITSLLFSMLHEAGVENHFLERKSETEQIVRKVDIIPLEVVVRNITAGSMAKRLGIEEGIPIQEPVVEFYYKDDSLGDPLITEDHIEILKLATPAEVDMLKHVARKVNAILSKFFASKDLRLVDFKLEFGKTNEGKIILADEVSPDTCRLWDIATNEKLDKDVFRRNLGSLTDAYEKILERIGGEQHV